MTSLFHRIRKSSARSGFTLVEMLTVLSIIAIMTGLGMAAFRGGSNGDGTRGAANAASSVFGQARAQAIMRRTCAAVIVDSDTTSTTSTTLYRRMMVVYLDPVSNVWVQASPWVTLPGNNYFDPKYSNPFGALAPALNGSTASYAYYAFDATGQAYLLSPSVPGFKSNTATTATGQFVVSPGRMSGTTFLERDTHSRYGFYLFPLGRMAFFQDVADDLNTPPANPLQ